MPDDVTLNADATETDFTALVLRYLDGMATDGEAARLAEELASRPARREEYVELCAMRALLEETVPPSVGAEPLPNDATVFPPMAFDPRVAPDAPSPPGAPSGGWPGGLSSFTSSPLLAAAFLVCVIAVSVGLHFAGRALWPLVPSAEQAPGVQRPTFAPEYVATLTQASNCRWDADELVTEVGARLAQSEIRLESGVAEIVFDQGTRVVLEGPARFTPQSSRAGFLRSGKLVSRVSARADRFTIQTPAAIVTGRGGEYGLAVDERGATELHVLAGAAEISVPDDSLAPIMPNELVAPAAMRVNAESNAMPQSIAARPMDFRRNIEQVQLAFPPDLVGYWNFDEQGGPAGDRAGRNDGALQGVKRIAGLVGRGALAFDDRHGQMVNVGAGEGTFTFTEGVTIEALIVSRWDGVSNLDFQGLNYDEIFRKDDGSRRMLLSFQYDGNDNKMANPVGEQGHVVSFGLNVGGKYEELDMPLDGKNGRPTLAKLTDGRPHHLVATYDVKSGEKTIYFDGRKCYRYEYPPGMPLYTDGPYAAAIGNSANLPWEAFHGTIDEFAVYRAALTAEEVARHWQRASNGECYFETAPPKAANNQQAPPRTDEI
jgi:ferric-dicitrate binding protein FerR (iron transport regulator)